MGPWLCPCPLKGMMYLKITAEKLGIASGRIFPCGKAPQMLSIQPKMRLTLTYGCVSGDCVITYNGWTGQSGGVSRGRFIH